MRILGYRFLRKLKRGLGHETKYLRLLKNKFRNYLPTCVVGTLISLFLLSVSGCTSKGPIAKSADGLPLFVTGYGVGATKDSALNDAFRDAIQRSAGVLVNSQLVQENGKITQDLLQEYSSAYISNYEVMRQGRAGSGMYEVDIAANVASTKLAARLGDFGKKGSASSLKGDQIYAQVSTQIKSRTQGDAFLTNLLSEFPRGALKVSVGSPKPGVTDNREVILVVPVEVKWSPSYLNALKQTVSFVAVDSCVAFNNQLPACNYQIAFHNPGMLGFGATRAYRLVDNVQAKLVEQRFNPSAVLVLNFYGEDDKTLARMCSSYDMSSTQLEIPGSMKPAVPLMSKIRGIEIYDRTYQSIRVLMFDQYKDIQGIKRIDAEVMSACPTGGGW